ncbi:MAG TPA: hypothetical protein VHG28_18540, partial [Longimicrobiaceae bacterium]|nr:hypothetical protein [Longimicrobiaceae bacterium]
MLLWESYRNVADWATTPRSRRTGDTFGAGAAERRTSRIEAEPGMRPELYTALQVIRDLLAHPRKVDPRTVALACRQISAWAEERGKPVTQFHFAAAAGLCLAPDGRQAYVVGCLARELARWDAA